MTFFEKDGKDHSPSQAQSGDDDCQENVQNSSSDDSFPAKSPDASSLIAQDFVEEIRRLRAQPHKLPRFTSERFRREPRPRSISGELSLKQIQHRSNNEGYPTMFRPEAGGTKKRFSSLLMITLTSFATLLIANSRLMDRCVAKLEFEHPIASASPLHDKPEEFALFNPLFGPQAVSNCFKECENSTAADQAICRRTCPKLSLSEYGRRIRLSENSAVEDANKVFSACTSTALPSAKLVQLGEWKEDFEKSINLLRFSSTEVNENDFAQSRLLYEKLMTLLTSLKHPVVKEISEKDRVLTEQILRTACLEAHLTLTNLAFVLVEQNHDSYSSRYYLELNRILKQPTVQAVQGILKEAKNVPAKSPLALD